MKLKRKGGQSTLEYLVIVAVVIAVIVVIATTLFRNNVRAIYERAGNRANQVVYTNMLP